MGENARESRKRYCGASCNKSPSSLIDASAFLPFFLPTVTSGAGRSGGSLKFFKWNRSEDPLSERVLANDLFSRACGCCRNIYFFFLPPWVEIRCNCANKTWLLFDKITCVIPLFIFFLTWLVVVFITLVLLFHRKMASEKNTGLSCWAFITVSIQQLPFSFLFRIQYYSSKAKIGFY